MAGRHRFNARHDLADRMTSATVGVTSQTYTWSGDGVRLSAATGAGAATTSFLVDRAAALPQVALERDGTGTVLRDEVYGLGRISVVGASGGIAYEHTDALGSVTDLTGSTGVPLAWSEASPYGAIRSAGAAVGAPADPFGFTGQFQDSPTGLYYLRARQYDPSIGRFLSTDPQPGGMADPYVSAYGYVSGNPVRYTDPSGRCLQFLGAAGAGLATGPGEAVIGPAALALFSLCVVFVAVAIETTAQVAVQISNSDRWYAEPGSSSLFKGTTRRELEKEVREAGWTARPGSGRGPHGIFEKPGRPDIKIPRHRDITPGVTRQIRDILRGGNAFGVFQGAPGSSMK